MSRMTINGALFEGKLVLDVIDLIQQVRARLPRVNNVMDFTRSGADFTALGTALGLSAADAATLYARMRAIEATMNTTDFTNLSDVDQG